MRLLCDLDLLPQMYGKDWRHTALQHSRGNITLNPKPPFADYLFLIKDVSYERLKRMMKHGISITYPCMCMLSNRLKLQDAIRNAIQSIHTNEFDGVQILSQMLNEGRLMSENITVLNNKKNEMQNFEYIKRLNNGEYNDKRRFSL